MQCIICSSSTLCKDNKNLSVLNQDCKCRKTWRDETLSAIWLIQPCIQLPLHGISTVYLVLLHTGGCCSKWPGWSPARIWTSAAPQGSGPAPGGRTLSCWASRSSWFFPWKSKVEAEKCVLDALSFANSWWSASFFFPAVELDGCPKMVKTHRCTSLPWRNYPR